MLLFHGDYLFQVSWRLIDYQKLNWVAIKEKKDKWMWDMTSMPFLKTLYKTFSLVILFRKQVEELLYMSLGFPSSSNGKESAWNVGDLGSIPGLGRTTGERHGNPLQYSCLENSMDREAWPAVVHGVSKSLTQVTELLSK